MSAHLKLVPWESWQLWSQVYDALFSSSPEAALNKVSAWKSRSSLPISVEITADLINIQRKDPYFSTICDPENVVAADMLRLMYSMAIMRLVNGVVDQSKWQNSTSVAERAEAAGLPRMLVDIRHEVAHKELPSLPFLQLASKEALKWLKAHYWEAQKQVLQDSSESIKNRLYDYASKDRSKGSRANKDLENLVKLVSLAVPEVATAVLNEGLLERCIAGDKTWQSVIGELSLNVPQLSRELVSRCLKDSKRDVAGMHVLSFLLGCAPKKSWSHHASRLVEMSDAALQLQKESDDPDAEHRHPPNSSNEDLGGMASNGSSNADETTDVGLKDGEKAILEAGKDVRMLLLRRRTSGMLLGEGSLLGGKDTIYTGKMKWAVVADEDWRPCAIGKLPDRIERSGAIPSFGTTLPRVELGEGETCGTVCGGEEVWDAASTETASTMLVVDDDDDDDEEEVDDDHNHHDSAEGVRDAVTATVEASKPSLKRDAETGGMDMDMEAGAGYGARIPSNGGGSTPRRLGRKTPVLVGTLLLDGVYKRCRIDELDAIRSAIHLLK